MTLSAILVVSSPPGSAGFWQLTPLLKMTLSFFVTLLRGVRLLKREKAHPQGGMALAPTPVSYFAGISLCLGRRVRARYRLE